VSKTLKQLIVSKTF